MVKLSLYGGLGCAASILLAACGSGGGGTSTAKTDTGASTKTSTSTQARVQDPATLPTPQKGCIPVRRPGPISPQFAPVGKKHGFVVKIPARHINVSIRY